YRSFGPFQADFGSLREGITCPDRGGSSHLGTIPKEGTHLTVSQTLCRDSCGKIEVAYLTLSSVTGDGFINANEAKNPVALSGGSTGLAQGAVVNITLDSSSTVVAQGVVQANGSWTASLDASALPDGTHTISGSASGVGTTVLQTIKLD